MAKKYIDIGRLRAEIEKLKEGVGIGLSEYEAGYHNGAGEVCNEILSVINSLQQKQPEVDLAKEIEKYYYDNFAFISSAHTPTLEILRDIAEHFHEIGQIDAANKYDEIEYNRQRAEEKLLGKTLDEAAWEYAPDLPSYIGGSISIAPEIRQDLRDAFKAGAKWMAGQGVILNLSIDDLSCGAYNACVEQGLTSEDDVIVQIRKK